MKPERSSSLAKGRAIDDFPPTPAALIPQSKRAVYQAVYQAGAKQ